MSWTLLHFLNYKAKQQTYCRYTATDYYLQELIEEWCEGVIQGNNQNLNQGEFSSSKTDRERPQSLLLEKVAEHLQKHIAESLTIDLQGLTKVCMALVSEL